MTRYFILVKTPIGWDCTDLVYRQREKAKEDMEMLAALHPDKEYMGPVNFDVNELAIFHEPE